MKYLILVSHGKFSEGLKDALGMFVGDNMDSVRAIGLQPGEDTQILATRFKKLVSELTADAELVVLGDIMGGSPLTTITNVLNQEGKLEKSIILGGMNFPMALNAAILKDSLSQQDLVTAIMKEAVSSVKQFSLVEKSNENDDDI
ncbi:PTS sugar transporter subunit IIA [Leuconostoc gelidum]|uniref:PTS fructose transporter subunit IIA n=1 Tax=Leuconostoc gelidum subsp. gelidum TaxID=1607839 RepID=A0AB35G0X1_LEUGE|nr:PTS fructose transporter subunit IIA [Leuconostoc gelidum]AFS40509.1 PTS system mannose/fructose-specific transporter subunit IIA [Leuconostoc gelidum JB7]MBZ5963643.1 PTS fructose transporter subunit IIA [Leuconostoc gelidum subsp. gelidum]MBZ5975514.1 PTS fructose transporter subunit IIA [Leuconostoc gelidum subsp. gelidum]MBZ5976316.1 PTS fructose transporter subunit IIA [Leuconostoc gelidum subsp. gelidum]MBZ5978410.1 PTS fructose transporter subunit IIA [Leuconostoc gelidum subsp. geli